MIELFDAHFVVGHRRYTYRLDQHQAAHIYQTIGHFISTGEGSDGFDLTFRETNRRGEEVCQTFRVDTADTFTLYRRLGTYLQKRFPGSEPLIRLHEAMS